MIKRVSVIMATYNGELFLEQQISSILSQMTDNDELIITDDCSTDNTINIISSFNDERIHLLKNQRNLGVIKNFEKGLFQAKGEYIFLCDQDDIWRNDKIEISLSYLKEADLIVSDCILIDDNNNQILDSFFKRKHSGSGVVKNIISNSYLGCCMAFKSTLLKTVLPFPQKIPMHDIWIGLIAGLFYKPIFVDEKLVYYRYHSSNNSSTAIGLSKYSLSKKIMFRINLVRCLPMAYAKKIFKYFF